MRPITTTKEQQYKLLKEKIRRQARDKYYNYIQYVYERNYRPNKLGEMLCTTIDGMLEEKERMRRNEIPSRKQLLMVSVPPRHGKSMHLTEALPSYYLGRFPYDEQIVVSYNDSIASKFGKKNKDLYNTFGEDLFERKIDSSSNSRTEFSVEGSDRGAYFAGIGASITGRGADLMIIDDPVKNMEDLRGNKLDAIWEEWEGTLRTRLYRDSIVIIIMTRWHEDDLIGRLLNSDYGKVRDWTYINVPLLCEDEATDPLHRHKGEQVIRGWLSEEDIEEVQSNPMVFNALYQGHPSAMEGNMIKRSWFNYYDMLPPCHYYGISVDATFKNTEKSDFVTIGLWGKYFNDYYLVEMINKRLTFEETCECIVRMHNKHKDKKIHATYIEDKANGSAILNVLRHKIPRLVAVHPERKGSKEARVWAITPILSQGHVYLPKYDAITNEFVDQCATFPKASHDDMVDNMTQIISEMDALVGTTIKEPEFHRTDFSESMKELREYQQSLNNTSGGGIMSGGYDTYI